jgi:dienelactone hydrolase
VTARRGPALALIASVLAACATGGGPPLAPAPDPVPLTIHRPAGSGPFPAVVIMHDCSGLGPRSSGAPGRWARELVGRGLVVLLPDSFGPRGFPDGVCTAARTRGVDVGPERRARDAYAALAQARALAEVDGRRVAIMGGSHGGTTTLVAMVDGAGPAGAGFAAAVALYPRCRQRARVVAPLLILIGDKDDWTPAEPCRRLAEIARQAGYPVAIKIYPGAHHAFDSPHPERYVATRINPSAPGGRGATTGGHPEAWADSIAEVTAFLERHLGVVPSRVQETR